jgi:hypothetical protein
VVVFFYAHTGFGVDVLTIWISSLLISYFTSLFISGLVLVVRVCINPRLQRFDNHAELGEQVAVIVLRVYYFDSPEEYSQ